MKTHIGLLLLLCSMGCASPKTAICDNMTQTSIKMPDGAPAAVVCCQHKADCYKLGTLACSGNYQVTQSNNAPASDFITSEVVSEYIILCK